MKSLIFITIISLFFSLSALKAQDDTNSKNADHIVDMPNLRDFDPETLTIKEGETVKWVNNSLFKHTVTCDSSKVKKLENVGLPKKAKEWDSGDIKPNESFIHTFNIPGTYKYFCIPHERMGMVGTIIVEEKNED